MNVKRVSGAFLILLITAHHASATTDVAALLAQVICGLVPELIILARYVAIAVFIYGGAKYAFSADDPGGRKQGKNIAINGLIGMLIVSASRALVEAIASQTVC
jgi:hypothetical protein